jgi:hypothetical protein
MTHGCAGELAGCVSTARSVTGTGFAFFTRFFFGAFAAAWLD